MEGEEEEVLVHDEPGDTFEVDTVRKDRSKDNKFKAFLLSKSLLVWNLSKLANLCLGGAVNAFKRPCIYDGKPRMLEPVSGVATH